MDACDRASYDARGTHTCTGDTECMHCKCDLFLSACVSPDRPGMCTCPEHVAALGAPADRCVLLYR